MPRSSYSYLRATSGSSSDSVQKYEGDKFRYTAPVPKPVCDFIVAEFSCPREQDFAFKLASHVIGSGGRAACPFELLTNIASSARLSVRSKAVAAIADKCLGFLDRSEPGKGRCREYWIRCPEMLGSSVRYVNLRDYRRKKCELIAAPRPYSFDEAYFTAHVREEGGFVPYSRDLVDALQEAMRHPIHIDVSAIIRDQSIWNDLSLNRRRHMLSQLRLYYPNDNYTRYSLQNSGRVGTANINAQGIPKKFRPHIKPREGYVHLYFDYHAQDPFVVAAISGDPELRAFQETHEDFYGALDAECRLGGRKRAKEGFNAMLYGRSEVMLACSLFGIDIDSGKQAPSQEQKWLAQLLMDAIEAKFPQVFAWAEHEAQRIIEVGEARSIGGTIRRSFDKTVEGRIKKDKARREGICHIVQGMGADIMRTLIVVLHQDVRLRQLGAYLLLPVHDAVLIELPVGAELEVAGIVHHHMTEVPKRFLSNLQLRVTLTTGWK